MITQNGYQGSQVSVVGANEFSQYAAGKGDQAWPLNYRDRLIGWNRRESLAGPYGGREFWLSAYEGGQAGQQATVAKQPVYLPGNANGEGTLQFSASQKMVYSLPAGFYNKLNGSGSYTIIARVRPRAWAGGNILGLTSDAGFSQYGVNANPAWGMVTQRGFLSSESTDLSQTTRYVAFVYENAGANSTVSITERGKRVSAAGSVVNETFTAAYIGAFFVDTNPWEGQIDEVIVLTGALSEAEVKAFLPYLYRDRYMNLLCFGNSIFEGYAGQLPFLCQLDDALPSGFGVSAAFCRGSITTANLLLAAKERTPGQIIPGATRALFWEETNAIQSGVSFNDLKAQCAAVRDYYFGLGIDVIRATVLPRVTFNAAQNAVRTAWNAELKQRPLLYASRADMVIKWDEDGRLQNAGNPAIYFDGIHPTTLGASYMVGDATAVLLAL